MGYLWSQLQFSKQETGGGSGVEFVEQRILTDPEPGKFTHRIYYLEKYTSILKKSYTHNVFVVFSAAKSSDDTCSQSNQ